MFVPSITVQPATIEQDVKNLEAGAVASAHLIREENVHQENAHHTEMTDASAHSDDDDEERLLSSGTGDALTDDKACYSECIKAACRRDMQVTREGEGPNGEESWAPEDEMNEDTFINSNCSEETEDLAEEQGMVEESDENVTNTEEKTERTTQNSSRRYKGIIARERSTEEIILIQIVGETWLKQEQRTMVIVLEDMTNGQIEVITYNEAQGIVTRKIENTNGHLRTICENLLELATIHVGQSEEEDSEKEHTYMLIEDDDNHQPTIRQTVRFIEQKEQRPCSGNPIHEDNEPMGWSEDISKRWTVYDTPSLTCKTSGVTAYQHPTHLRTHNRESTGPQTAVLSLQSESSKDMPFLGPEESKQCYNDVVCKKCLNMNEITEVNDDELCCLHKEKAFSPQMAATLF
jgi:hypothetical protein